MTATANRDRGDRPHVGLGDVPPAGLDLLLAVTRATSRLLEQLGADVPLASAIAQPRTLREACRTVELQVAATRLLRSPRARGSLMDPRATSPAAGEVLNRLLRGQSEKEIAAWLSLSPDLIRALARSIYATYGVRGQPELIAQFIDGPE